jgi:shikimate kinase
LTFAKNLVLIGYRGAGKSTLSRQIKKKCGIELFSTDEELVRRFAQPISEWIKKNNWEKFRDIESEIVNRLSTKTGVLIDCGGGIVERNKNVVRLRETGIVFYLQTSVETLAARIRLTGGRPSLTGKGDAASEIKEVMARREPLYLAAAHHVVDVSDAGFFSASDKIIQLFKQELGV